MLLFSCDSFTYLWIINPENVIDQTGNNHFYPKARFPACCWHHVTFFQLSPLIKIHSKVAQTFFHPIFNIKFTVPSCNKQIFGYNMEKLSMFYLLLLQIINASSRAADTNVIDQIFSSSLQFNFFSCSDLLLMLIIIIRRSNINLQRIHAKELVHCYKGYIIITMVITRHFFPSHLPTQTKLITTFNLFHWQTNLR